MRLIAIALLVTSAFGCSTASAPSVVIRNVSVVDSKRPAPRHGLTVLIRGERIARVALDRAVRLPRGARVIDGKGKYLIPGLWDMHVHTLREGRPEIFFPLFIANGVTGVRDMGTPLADFEKLAQLRREIASGQRTGPRIVAAGPPLDGGKQARPELSMRVASADDGQAAVRMLRDRGADFIKVVNFLDPEAYRAIVRESQRLGLPVAGHIPWAVSPAEVATAGQKSIEHLGSAYVGVLLGCSTEEEEIRQRVVAAISGPLATAASVLPTNRALSQRTLSTFDTAKAAQLFDQFRRSGTWQVPTLVLLRSFAFGNDPAFTRDDQMAYLPESMTRPWLPENNLFYRGMTEEEAAHGRELYAKQTEIVGDMVRAGVRIMAGSDTPNPFVYPGFSLHDELELLVRAGMTPGQALHAATSAPAEFLGLGDQLGAIEEGMLADLVLLSANPLENIAHTRAVLTVIANGRVLESEELEVMRKRLQR